jgi:hypothetical protein
MSDEEKQGQGFRVSDRRRFTASDSGEVRKEQEAPEAERKAPDAEEKPPETKEAAGETPPAEGQGDAAEKKPEEDRQQEPAQLPEINFSTFVVSLSSSALIHMGIVPDPLTGETKKELALAKQTIDMLGMLQEKTRGNLTDDEAQLMESMLYDLRMRYVEESK